MPEYFDDEIPMAGRKAKNFQICRNTRRYWPQDVLVKEIVHDSRHDYRISFDHHRMMFRYYSHQGDYARRKLVSILNKPDQFGIKRIDIPHSLNKDKRWEIPEKLSERIVDFQDDLNRIRVSHCKEIIRDYRVFRGRWDYTENVDSYAIELSSVKDGQEIHKFYKNANPLGLLKKPRPCRRKSRRNRSNTIEDDDEDKEKGIHFMYKAKQTTWDRRVQKRSQKIIPRKLEYGDKQTVKKNIRTRDDLTGLAFLTSDMDLIEDSNSESASTSPCRIGRDFKVNVFKECLIHKKLKKGKKRCQELQDDTQSYCGQNLETIADSFIVEDFTNDIESISTSSEDSILNESMFMLPSIDINLPSAMNFGEYVRERFSGARKVQHMYPETFIVYVSNETVGETGHSFNDFNGWITCRVAVQSDTECTIRILLNADESNKQAEGLEDSSKNANKLGPVENIPSFLPDFINPNVLSTCSSNGYDKDKHIKEWLFELNEECKASIPTSTFCNVCFAEDPDGFALSCGHYFCRFCWANNAVISIQQYQCPITCMMNGCFAVVEIEHIHGLLKRSFCKSYENILFNKLVLTKGWMYCEKCFELMVPKESTSCEKIVIVCECGGAACLKCKTPFHAPLSCDLALEYRKILTLNGENMNEIVFRKKDRIQRCPKCMQCCIKIDGCPHITCVCGASFCYACGKGYGDDVSHEDCDYDDRPGQISLFDVTSAPEDKNLQLAFELNHIYRENRTSSAIYKLRKKVGPTVDFEPIFRCYIAANEVLELSSVYQLYTKLFKKTTKKKIEYNLSHNALIKQVDRLQFALHRFIDTIENCKRDERYIEKAHMLGNILRDILSSGYSYRRM